MREYVRVPAHVTALLLRVGIEVEHSIEHLENMGKAPAWFDALLHATTIDRYGELISEETWLRRVAEHQHELSAVYRLGGRHAVIAMAHQLGLSWRAYSK